MAGWVRGARRSCVFPKGESGVMALRPVVGRRAPRDGAVRLAGPAGSPGATSPVRGPGVVADGVGEEGGGKARCARQGATAAMRGVPRRAVVHLPLHGKGRGALRVLVAR